MLSGRDLHEEITNYTVFFFGVYVLTKGVAYPPPGISCRPRKSAGWVWRTILPPQPSARVRFGGYLRACVPRAGEGILVSYPLGRASSIGRHPEERVRVASGIRTRSHLRVLPWLGGRESTSDLGCQPDGLTVI